MIKHRPNSVAPPVGAWIEIFQLHGGRFVFRVAPPVGAWIEILPPVLFMAIAGMSLPPWERGLK